MGFWSSIVGGNDYYLDIEANIVEICGLDVYDYFEDNSLLTTELFNRHFDSIVKLALNRNEHEGPIALGVLILKCGACLPESIKKIILKDVDLELNDYVYEDLRFKRMRATHLKTFRDKIESYEEGTRINIKEESLIGLSFIRGLLNPVLDCLFRFQSPYKMQEFVHVLLEDLNTPLEEVCKSLQLNSRKDLLRFFVDLEEFGKNVNNISKREGKQGEVIVMLARLFINRIESGQQIENAWLGNTNLNDLRNTPELEEEDGPKYFVYKLSLFGKLYIGQCNISTNKRTAQHISKFKIAP